MARSHDHISEKENTLLNHILRFHTQSLAEQAAQTLSALSVPIQSLRVEGIHTLCLSTPDELDDGTIALILEKTQPLSAHFNESQQEVQARAAIVAWARDYFKVSNDNVALDRFTTFQPMAEIEVLGIMRKGDTWKAELQIDTIIDNPRVLFSLDQQGEVKIIAVEF